MEPCIFQPENFLYFTKRKRPKNPYVLGNGVFDSQDKGIEGLVLVFYYRDNLC